MRRRLRLPGVQYKPSLKIEARKISNDSPLYAWVFPKGIGATITTMTAAIDRVLPGAGIYRNEPVTLRARISINRR